jgi:hypothetical protein
MNRRTTVLNALLGVCGLLILSSEVLAQTTWTVDRLSESGDGTGVIGDLRYCLTNAADSDRIVFSVEGIINLTAPLPILTRSITIQGPGASLLTVRQATEYGILNIFTVWNATVSISGVTVANADFHGFANDGTLTLSNTTAAGNGGGIWNNYGRTTRILNSSVTGNGDGGGIDNRGTMTIVNSTISGNSSYDFQSGGGYGAGIANLGMLSISGSTIAGNYASGDPSTGGGIGNGFSATLVIDNSTISGNFSNVYGGGLANSGTVTIANSTIAGNRAEADYGAGGGIFNQGAMTVRNTILANNTSPSGTPDLAGSLGSLGHNLISSSSSGTGYQQTDLLDIDPLLGALQNNGGVTLTHALLEDSLAIDRGDNSGAPAWDQRGDGFVRIANGVIDIGAFELSAGFNCLTPLTPAGLTAAGGDAQVALEWSANPDTAAYTVQRATTSGGPYTAIASALSAATYIDAGLTNGTTYWYVVSGTNACGESANSAEVSATPMAVQPPPSAPTQLNAVSVKAKVTLTWAQSSSPGVTHNKIYRSTTAGGPYAELVSISANTSYTDMEVTRRTMYYYVVTAASGQGESAPSNQDSAKPK